MWELFVKRFADKQNRSIVIVILLIHIVILTIGWRLTKPFFKEPPCAICGRSDTYPVRVLYQYKVRVIPYVVEQDIFYCKKHAENVPQIVTEMPNVKDRVGKRFWSCTISMTAIFGTLLFILTLLELSYWLLAIYPFFVIFIFSFFGIVSNITMTTFLLATLAIPIAIFIVWNQWINSQK
ncbi:MAG: hypothetical protein PHW79_09490 [Candidatus Marinimicrobia bacterium]|jgi:hypothetical protein|nr:hypothetical protein [Candidatus Neomarinimicrobiota bacterium]